MWKDEWMNAEKLPFPIHSSQSIILVQKNCKVKMTQATQNSERFHTLPRSHVCRWQDQNLNSDLSSFTVQQNDSGDQIQIMRTNLALGSRM